MKLSAAVIARDAERHIVRCLKSIRPVVDEIVFVDTGSKDNTAALARPYADIFAEEPWRDDFAWHRNHSFSLCGGDWILQIDADEEFKFSSGGSVALLKETLRKIDNCDAVALTLKNWSAQRKVFTSEIELFRIFRSGRVHFRRKIHNEPFFEGPAVYFPFCHLVHHGVDLTEEERRKKAERTIGGLLKMLDENPDDPENHYYLANAYIVFKDDIKSAIHHAQKYLSCKARIDKRHFHGDIYHLLANCWLQEQKYDLALKILVEGVSDGIDSPDLFWDIGMVGMKLNDLPMLITAYEKYMDAAGRTSSESYRVKNAGHPLYRIDPNSRAAIKYYAGAASAAYGLNLLEEVKAYAKENCVESASREIQDRIEQFEKKYRIEKEKERVPVASSARKAYPDEIDVVVPWYEGDLGEAYNRIMRKARGWVCFLDHDVMHMHPDWYRILKRAVNSLGKRVGWISGVTNAIGCPVQLSEGAPPGHDILLHRGHALAAYKRFGERAVALGDIPERLSGFMILTHREAWEEAGRFDSGFLGVDNLYDEKLRRAGYGRVVLPGLYLYHTYRAKQ